MAYLVGIDLGRTQLRAAVVDSEGGYVVPHSIAATMSHLGTDAGSPEERARVVQDVVTQASEALAAAHLEWESIAGIGLAVPFPVTPDGKLIVARGDSIGWNGIDISHEFEEVFRALGTTCLWVGNDVNAHAMGEAAFGVGRDLRPADLVYLAVGSGIGAGLVLQGKLRVGAQGCAGEYGHIVVDSSGPLCDGCGRQNGCLEMLSSGSAIARRAAELIDEGKAPGLASHFSHVARSGQSEHDQPVSSHVSRSIGATIDAKSVIELALSPHLGREGKESLKIVHEAGIWLGHGLVQIIHGVNPQMIVIGGSVAQAGPIYLDAARQWVKEHALEPCASTPIVASALQTHTAILGAAAAAMSTASSI